MTRNSLLIIVIVTILATSISPIFAGELKVGQTVKVYNLNDTGLRFYKGRLTADAYEHHKYALGQITAVIHDPDGSVREYHFMLKFSGKNQKWCGPLVADAKQVIVSQQAILHNP